MERHLLGLGRLGPRPVALDRLRSRRMGRHLLGLGSLGPRRLPLSRLRSHRMGRHRWGWRQVGFGRRAARGAVMLRWLLMRPRERALDQGVCQWPAAADSRVPWALRRRVQERPTRWWEHSPAWSWVPPEGWRTRAVSGRSSRARRPREAWCKRRRPWPAAAGRALTAVVALVRRHWEGAADALRWTPARFETQRRRNLGLPRVVPRR
jgi:hypothetical protein